MIVCNLNPLDSSGPSGCLIILVQQSDLSDLVFQLSQEAQVYKEIEEIDPAKHIPLSLDLQGLANLREATIKDDSMSELAKVIQQGWPDLKQNVPLSIRAFWPFRNELVGDNGIIFKGKK